MSLKLLFATDMHGNRKAYDDLAAMAGTERADAVILGGDLLPGDIDFDNIPNLQERFVRSFLPRWLKRCPAPVYWILGNDDTGYLAETLADWDAKGRAFYIHERERKMEPHGLNPVAPTRLRPAGFGEVRPTQKIQGDISPKQKAMCIYPQHCSQGLLRRRINRLWTIRGYAYVPVTPFSLKDWEKYDDFDQEYPDSGLSAVLSVPKGFVPLCAPADELRPRGTIEEDLAKIPAGEGWNRTIFVSHSPPFDTKLDVLYNHAHCGSRAIRRCIERVQPSLTLHGHIHESPERSGAIVDRIGRTVCVNPGGSVGGLRAALCEYRRGGWTVALASCVKS